MDKKPTLKEFLRDNPNKGLNDYFQEWGQDPEPVHPEYHPPQENINPTPPPTPVEPPPVVEQPPIQQYQPPTPPPVVEQPPVQQYQPPSPPPPTKQYQNPQQQYQNPQQQYQNPQQQYQVNKPPVQQDNTYVNQPKSYLTPTRSAKTKVSILSILGAILVIAALFLPWINVESLKGFKDIVTVTGLNMPEAFEKIMGYQHTLLYHTIYAITAGGAIALLGEISRSWVLRILGQVIAVAFGIFWIYNLYTSYGHITTELNIKDLELFKYLQYGSFMMVGGITLFFLDMLRTMFGK